MPSWPGIRSDEEGINFTNHQIDFTLNNANQHIAWLIHAISEEGYNLQRVDFIFCADTYLLEINRSYLGHDYFTDIITFPFEENPILGEIYISIDRVKENADSFDIPFEEELRRVMIHGILHLCGYDDHEEPDIEEIRDKEDKYIHLYPTFQQ